MGRKVSDKYTVPLCRLHHRELHRRGNERKWWHGYGIKPSGIASGLWKQSHAGEIPETPKTPDGALNGAKLKMDGSAASGKSHEPNSR